MPTPTNRSTLFLVHAHPDDESLATGGVIARTARAGHRVVLVTCTRGEEGEIHALEDAAAARHRLGDVRAAELRRACAILGVDRLALLDYRDSGMAGSPANQHPASFHRAPLGEVAGRLAALLWEERPAVVVTYGPDGTYGHPDHVKAHRATGAALDWLERRGWRPDKTYWHAVPRSALRRLGMETPFRGTPDDRITTEVDVRDVLARKLAAFDAHVTQRPTTLACQLLDALAGAEHFVLARRVAEWSLPERCLFAGLEGPGAPATAEAPSADSGLAPSAPGADAREGSAAGRAGPLG